MIDRRLFVAGGLAGAILPSTAAAQGPSEVYTEDEVIAAASDFLETTAGAAGQAVERVFRVYGRPAAYIKGREGSGSWVVGLRYGSGELVTKTGLRRQVFWRGPTIGWDFGGNGAKVFTLVYGMTDPEQIFRRFPGVEGSAYFVGGLGVNYQKAGEIVLAPIRAGVGLRAGANVGYLTYARKGRALPF